MNIADLSIVLASYNQTSSAAGLAAVPEPSTLVVAATALLGLLAAMDGGRDGKIQ